MSSPEVVDELALAADPETSPTVLGQLAGKSLALAMQVAGNPSTTPRILRRIAMTWSDARAEVARHPELERTLAAVLGMEHPEALCANPSIPPRIASRRSLPHKVVAHLLAQKAPPRWLLPALVAHPQPKMRALAAEYAGTTAEVVKQLSHDADPGVRAVAAKHASLSLEELRRLATEPMAEVRAAVAERQDLPPELQRILARDRQVGMVQWRLARHATDEEALAMMAKVGDIFVGRDLASNPATPPHALEHLASLSSQDVYLRVAAHPRTPLPVLLQLLAEPKEKSRFVQKQVQDAVLGNPALPLSHFAQLLSTPTTEMRLSLAECRRTPVAMLRGLAVGDPDDRVRTAAAANEACVLGDDAGQKLARALARDASPFVRKAVARRSPDVSLLSELAKDVSTQVRAAVASSPHVSPALLARLASEKDLQVRLAVARHPAAPAETLRALMHDESSEVWGSAMSNPGLRVDDLLVELGALPSLESMHFYWAARRLENVDPGDPLWQRALRLYHPHVEQVLAHYGDLPLDAAQALSRSPHDETRRVLAAHSLRGSVLLLLAGDLVAGVRLALAKRLDLSKWRPRSVAPVAELRQLAFLLARDPSEPIRAQVASSTGDDELLAQLSRDAASEVRLGALRNPATPPSILLAALRLGGADEHAARGALVRRGHPRLGVRPPKP